MGNELQVINEFQPDKIETTETAIEQSRAIAEVQGAIISAKRFPRDQFSAMKNILKDCERFTLAEKANYTYPRGGTTVSGPSIRLAEAIAQRWGNLDYGIRELEQRDGESCMQAYCWDLETNTRRTMNFTVKHERHTRKGKYSLDDPRDIYELTANQGSRRVRSCILAVVPGDVTEKAVEACKMTIARGDGKKTLKDRLTDMVTAFDKLGVPQDAIEKKLEHKIELTVETELADLIGIYNSIKDNIGSRTQYFDIAGEIKSEKTMGLNEKLKQEKL